MTFEKFFGQSKKKPENNSEKKESLFEIDKRIKGIDFSIGIKKNKEPIKGSFDIENKKARVEITPEGIEKGAREVYNFIKDPESRKKIDKWADKIGSWLSGKKERATEKEPSEEEKAEERIREEILKARKKAEAEGTIREYAEQEGKSEAKIIEELLNDIGKEEGDNKE